MAPAQLLNQILGHRVPPENLHGRLQPHWRGHGFHIGVDPFADRADHGHQGRAQLPIGILGARSGARCPLSGRIPGRLWLCTPLSGLGQELPHDRVGEIQGGEGRGSGRGVSHQGTDPFGCEQQIGDRPDRATPPRQERSLVRGIRGAGSNRRRGYGLGTPSTGATAS